MTTARIERGSTRQIAPDVGSRRVGKTTILYPAGVNDRQLQNSLLEALRSAGLWVAVDLNLVADINSGLLGLLVASARELTSRQGWLGVLRPSQFVRRLLALTGTNSVLPVVEDETAFVADPIPRL